MMTELPPEAEGLDVVIEIQGIDESSVAALRGLFDGEDEDVIFSHAFGGLDSVSIIATLTANTLAKLGAVWARLKTSSPKTTLTINKTSLSFGGFTQPEIEALLASPNFQKAVRTARKP